jgi:hypothetical protein
MMKAAALLVASMLMCATVSAEGCEDHDLCADGMNMFVKRLGYGCESTVFSIAEQIGQEAVDDLLDFGNSPQNEFLRVGEFCPVLCTEICADVPAGESCSGTDYCTREMTATLSLGGFKRWAVFPDNAGETQDFQEALEFDISANIGALLPRCANSAARVAHASLTACCARATYPPAAALLPAVDIAGDACWQRASVLSPAPTMMVRSKICSGMVPRMPRRRTITNPMK